MRAQTSLGLVLGGFVAICCSAGQTATGGRVTPPQPDAGAPDASNDVTLIVEAGKPPDLNTGDGSTTTMTDDRPSPTCTKNCMDFPTMPLLDDKAPTMPPANAAALFGAADNMGGSGGCVLEPQLAQGSDPGALFPANWLRPRFRWQPLAGENLWEVRLHADAEANDFVAYTTATTYALPKSVWTALANNIHMVPITVTIRGVNTASPAKPSGTKGSFQIAPVYAGGSLVYWASTSPAINPTASRLVGFHVGDESVIDALTIPQVQRQIIGVDGMALRVSPDPGAIKNPPGAVQCIGCHTSTPDGKAVAFTDLWPWNGVLASIEASTVGQQPAYVTAGAATLLNQPWLGMLSFSKSQWADGKHLAVSAYGGRTTSVGFSLGNDMTPKTTLAWFDLDTTAAIPWTAGMPGPTNTAIAAAEKTAWGRLALSGEKAAVVSPAFSHDGKSVFYTSADVEQDGRIGTGNTDVNIHVVPFNAGAGGAVTPLAGAAEPGVAEYYPSLSVDDHLVAFNRVSPIDTAAIYYRADGEINVIPSAGGKATRLAANDPPACGMQKSPGVINSWPKWSPDVETDSGKNYYWLIFSSARAYPGQFMMDEVPGISPPDRRSSQLYMTAVVEDTTTHELKTFDGVYLWNQGAMTTNLTPAWDEFKIPPIPPPK